MVKQRLVQGNIKQTSIKKTLLLIKLHFFNLIKTCMLFLREQTFQCRYLEGDLGQFQRVTKF